MSGLEPHYAHAECHQGIALGIPFAGGMLGALATATSVKTWWVFAFSLALGSSCGHLHPVVVNVAYSHLHPS
jgi:hypothetical protein